MKRFLALLMVCLLVFSVASAQEMTMAEKLYKQLWAGSGFSGTLTAQVDTEGFRTSGPLVADVDYIYVRTGDDTPEEHRVDVTLKNGESDISAAHAQLREGRLAFQADVLSPGWFILNTSAQTEAASEAVEKAVSRTGTPALAKLLVTGAAAVNGNAALKEALESYLTRVDVWIEGYRQDAVLSKLEDGTTVMEVHYLLAPAAIKAQVKQMIVDVINDEKTLALLAEAIGEENAQLYLNPALQNWYFEAVDALPFPGDLLLSRTLAMTGETVDLHLALPLYDAQTGVATVSYDRTRAEGDLPEENVIRLETAERDVRLTYQTYSSMTGVQVMQGTLVSQPVQDFAVEEEENITAAAFTLKMGTATTLDEQGRNVYTCEYALTAAPAEGGTVEFDEIEIALNASFVSKQMTTAATGVTAQLDVRYGDDSVNLTFDGASRKKWTPEAVPGGIEIDSFAQAAFAELLPGALIRTMAVLAPFIAE